MPLQRSISRIVTPGPAVAGCQKVGHSFIEVIHADDFINADPFIRLSDDRMEIGNKEIGAPHPHAGFEALGLLLEGAIRNRENGALLNPGDRSTLLTRNLHEVFGEDDPARQRGPRRDFHRILRVLRRWDQSLGRTRCLD